MKKKPKIKICPVVIRSECGRFTTWCRKPLKKDVCAEHGDVKLKLEDEVLKRLSRRMKFCPYCGKRRPG